MTSKSVPHPKLLADIDGMEGRHHSAEFLGGFLEVPAGIFDPTLLEVDVAHPQLHHGLGIVVVGMRIRLEDRLGMHVLGHHLLSHPGVVDKKRPIHKNARVAAEYLRIQRDPFTAGRSRPKEPHLNRRVHGDIVLAPDNLRADHGFGAQSP